MVNNFLMVPRKRCIKTSHIQHSLEPGNEHVITVPDVFPMVSINAVGQEETNHGEYEWFYQEHHEEYGDKQEIVISYPEEDFYDEINLRARIYHVKWVEWME